LPNLNLLQGWFVGGVDDFLINGFAKRLIVVYKNGKGAKNMNKLRSGKKRYGERFFLDRNIIVLLYKTNARENMNKLRSGRPWLTVMDIFGERHNPCLSIFLCINISY